MFVEVHPDTAARQGLSDGDRANVTSRRGHTPAVVRVRDTVPTDVIFLPFHWSGEERANSVTQAALDPTSRMPEFKVCAVRLESA